MALIIFGAGATRGAAFVDSTKDPCLPFLDRDFFAQLQRIRNPKHQALIRDVMRDAVAMFGSNFDATMEAMFTTLEHTLRMLQTTGENRDFNRRDLREKRDRLVQAVAAVLEESLAEKDEEGHSKHTMKRCSHHDRFVGRILNPQDALITFNYDCVLDDSLRRWGSDKWTPRYGYGFDLGARGKKLTGDKHWSPASPPPRAQTAHLYKLHGSLHFQVTEASGGSRVHLKQHPYTKRRGNLDFTIIPPEWHKAYDKGVFARLWHAAAGAINGARHIVFVGYSLPPTDLHSTALFRTSVKKGNLRSIVVANPDPGARRRIRSVLQRGMSPQTRVLSMDSFAEFVAIDRSVWEV